MQFTNYGNINTIVLMLVFHFLTVLFFTSLKLRCKFLFFSCKISYFSFAKLNISSAISPQSPQSFCFFVQFYFMSCMCYLFEDFSWSSTFWTNNFFVCENTCICWQILFHFLNRYLCRSSALRHVKILLSAFLFLAPRDSLHEFLFSATSAKNGIAAS